MTRRQRPILAVWNDGLGKYEEADPNEELCLARWRSDGPDHLAGHLCCRKGEHEAGGTWFCGHHFKEITRWRHESPLRSADVGHEIKMAVIERDAEHRAAEERKRQASGVVYYVLRDDGLVKIGTTTRFGRRMSRLRQEHGKLRVLLVHHGGREHEDEMHNQFSEWRVRGEWFILGRPLATHILGMRRHAAIEKCCQERGAVSRSELNQLFAGCPKVAA